VKPSPYLREILTLDPQRDCQRIVHLDTVYEFPFDTTRSLELALFRTFASPSISALLDASGEFARRAQKRYDDTDLILSTLAESGYESEEGKQALRQMNRMHARFEIAAGDFLYVLSTFVLEPIRWNERFGWRPLVEQERLAAFHFWREVGTRMAIEGIPATLAELEELNMAYERERFVYVETNRRVALAARDMFLAWFPGLPTRLGTLGIAAVMDERLRSSLGFPRPRRALVAAVAAALRARGHVARTLPPRRRPRLRTKLRHRSYPDGWRLGELGTLGATRRDEA
jgi:hypothetical protein